MTTKRRRRPVKMATKKVAVADRRRARKPEPHDEGPGRHRVVKMAVKKPRAGKPSWMLDPADTVVRMPDGGTTTTRALFPGLYGPAPVPVSPERAAARQDPATATMDAAAWPVPCPDCTGPESPITRGLSIGVADPVTPGQVHHAFCHYWDATHRTPF